MAVSLFIPGIRQSVRSDSLIRVCKIRNLLALVKIIENYPVCKKVVFPYKLSSRNENFTVQNFRTFGPQCEKTHLWGLRTKMVQTTCTSAQSDQRLCCSLLATSQFSIF